ncbi:MAG: carbohydrate kinase family protein, partial [Candidatus Saccharimonadales bacterium]
DHIGSCIDKIKDISNTVIIKQGTEGVVAWNNGQTIKRPAFLNTHVEDAIGAGDSFNAGFIHKFLQNKPFEECLEFGTLCGAINTTAHGGTAAFQSAKDIQQIALKQFKYHLDDV